MQTGVAFWNVKGDLAWQAVGANISVAAAGGMDSAANVMTAQDVMTHGWFVVKDDALHMAQSVQGCLRAAALAALLPGVCPPHASHMDMLGSAGVQVA